MIALLLLVVAVAVCLAMLGRRTTPKSARRPLFLWLLEDSPSDLEKGVEVVGRLLQDWHELERGRIRRRQPWLRDEQGTGE